MSRDAKHREDSVIAIQGTGAVLCVAAWKLTPNSNCSKHEYASDSHAGNGRERGIKDVKRKGQKEGLCAHIVSL